MEVAPFFVDFHHFLSIFTIFYRFSWFTHFCRDLHFVAIYALFPQIFLAKIAFSATSHVFCMYVKGYSCICSCICICISIYICICIFHHQVGRIKSGTVESLRFMNNKIKIIDDDLFEWVLKQFLKVLQLFPNQTNINHLALIGLELQPVDGTAHQPA